MKLTYLFSIFRNSKFTEMQKHFWNQKSEISVFLRCQESSIPVHFKTLIKCLASSGFPKGATPANELNLQLGEF